jgi:glutamate formiminotransferase/glutamate formiminotransferase/formiminotetrahydrofolate cyclodeaminase
MPLLEVVPNVSEGRDATSIGAIAGALEGEPGVRLLDLSSDPDHHRSVLTAAGEPEPLERALLEMTRIATTRIDLRRHHGVHPRLGAVDVVPFVPLGAALMDDAVAAAHRLGRAIGDDLGIPVFLYGEAASDAGRRQPASLRRLGLPGVAAALASGALRPDYGPARAHPTAGVTLVGARTFLIAFNVWLATASIGAAREIARAIRERDSGLPGVQALGFYLESRGRAQVSINLVRPGSTPLESVVERVRAEAAARGIEIERGELIGLLPEAVASRTTAQALLLPELGPDQILERRLRLAGLLAR